MLIFLERKRRLGAAVIQQIDAITGIIPGGGGWVKLFAEAFLRCSCGQLTPTIVTRLQM